MDKENKLILYNDENGKLSVNVRFADDDVWLTQAQLVDIYQSSKSNISEHIKHIFEDRELDETVVVRKFRITTQHGAMEGKTQSRDVAHYNLDVIIALGYRVQSTIAVRFRRWATQRLHEYIQKGFTIDDERLKQGGNRYFKELLQRIRDIRSSERNFYQQVTDIYATSTDYDPRAKTTKMFFATVQNKMHYAVHEHTAAELIYERVDNEKPLVGMTNFKGNYVTCDDVKIAKNYLTEMELQRLNLLTSQFLDYAEFQALEQNPMSMTDWIAALDDHIMRLRKNILQGNGAVSHQEAIEKAEREFEIYREREMRLLESDFDKAVKRLRNRKNGKDENKPE
ncbi:MAG: virulence RhuM family protein [Prevotella sp.]|nr:virulence RhuM family protein [Prevotella sp.]